MIGHDHLGKVRLGQVKITSMSLYLLWTYSENFVKIHQDLAKIWKFISTCFKWVAVVMIGRDHLMQVILGKFMYVCPPWSYTENNFRKGKKFLLKWPALAETSRKAQLSWRSALYDLIFNPAYLRRLDSRYCFLSNHLWHLALSMSSSLYLIGQGCEVSSNEMLSWNCSARYECRLLFFIFTHL